MSGSAGSAKIRLITRGDDAGSCRSANRAVIEAAERGVLRNVSVMMPGPAAEDAAALLGRREDICLGLHLTLTAEWEKVRWGPVLGAKRVPSLVDERGHFHPKVEMLQRNGAALEQMVAEAQAQLARARELGLEVRYIDAHMGVTWLPGLKEAVAELARQEGLINAAIHGGLPKAAQPAKGDDPVAALLGRLAAAPPGTYVFVTHPASDDPETRDFHVIGEPQGEVAAEREADRRLLCDRRLIEGMLRLGVEPVRYDEA
jgi:chitin disaccharide deacetylase